MSFGGSAELAFEAPMRPECDEQRRLFPALTAQDLLYGFKVTQLSVAIPIPAP